MAMGMISLQIFDMANRYTCRNTTNQNSMMIMGARLLPEPRSAPA